MAHLLLTIAFAGCMMLSLTVIAAMLRHAWYYAPSRGVSRDAE